MAKGRKAIVWLIVLALAGGGLAYAWASGLLQQATAAMGKSSPAASSLRFHTVRVGDLTIGLTEGGQLRALKNYTVSSQLRGNSKISWVVPEGKQVVKGDKIIELDSKAIQDSIRAKQGDVEAAQRQLVVAEENLKIEASNGKSMVAAAQARLEDAREALKRFIQLDAPKRFKDMEAAANTSRKALNDAVDAGAAAQTKLDDAMSGDETQVATLQQAVTTAQNSVRLAAKQISSQATEQKMYKCYDYPRELTSRKQAVANAELDLEKAKVSAKSSLLQKEAEIGRVKDSLTRVTKDIADCEKDLSRCLITAPVDGMVLYGDVGSGGGRMYYGGPGPAEIKVGADVWQGQNLLTIPDLSTFEIDISIGEEYRGKLKPPCRAVVTIEAISIGSGGHLVIEGNLKDISRLAQSRNPYDPASPKVFTGVVQLTNNDPRMVSGMSAKVEIIADVLHDVLHTPVESVFDEGGKTVCYVRTGSQYEKRMVKTGASNDDSVQIVYGLREGEEVCLFKPAATDVVPSTMPSPPPDPVSASRPASMPATVPTGIGRLGLPASAPASAPATMPAGAPALMMQNLN